MATDFLGREPIDCDSDDLLALTGWIPADEYQPNNGDMEAA